MSFEESHEVAEGDGNENLLSSEEYFKQVIDFITEDLATRDFRGHVKFHEGKEPVYRDTIVTNIPKIGHARMFNAEAKGMRIVTQGHTSIGMPLSNHGLHNITGYNLKIEVPNDYLIEQGLRVVDGRVEVHEWTGGEIEEFNRRVNEGGYIAGLSDVRYEFSLYPSEDPLARRKIILVQEAIGSRISANEPFESILGFLALYEEQIRNVEDLSNFGFSD